VNVFPQPAALPISFACAMVLHDPAAKTASVVLWDSQLPARLQRQRPDQYVPQWVHLLLGQIKSSPEP
jgi:hypothetical protein